MAGSKGAAEIDETFSDEETARRRDEVVRRMLNTPPKRHVDEKRPRAKKGAKGDDGNQGSRSDGKIVRSRHQD